MEIYQLKEYQSWNTSIMIYWPLADSNVVVVGGYYLMKREGMLEWQEGWQLMDYVKDIPVMLKQVFPKKGTSEAEAWKKEKKPLAQPKTEAEKVLLIVKDNLFPVPPLFRLIQEQSGTPWEEMYKVFNMGHRMEIYTDEEIADDIIAISKSFNIDAQIVGRCYDNEEGKGNKLTIISGLGKFIY